MFGQQCAGNFKITNMFFKDLKDRGQVARGLLVRELDAAEVWSHGPSW